MSIPVLFGAGWLANLIVLLVMIWALQDEMKREMTQNILSWLALMCAVPWLLTLFFAVYVGKPS